MINRRIIWVVTLTVAVGVAVSQPIHDWTDPLRSIRLDVDLDRARRSVLLDPPASLVIDTTTGRRMEFRGYFAYERKEAWWGVPLRVRYAFSTKDSTMGYVLATYIESTQISRSTVGLRDSLWDRLKRSQGVPQTESTTHAFEQCVWSLQNGKLVATRSGGAAKTMVISLTRRPATK